MKRRVTLDRNELNMLCCQHKDLYEGYLLKLQRSDRAEDVRLFSKRAEYHRRMRIKYLNLGAKDV